MVAVTGQVARPMARSDHDDWSIQIKVRMMMMMMMMMMMISPLVGQHDGGSRRTIGEADGAERPGRLSAAEAPQNHRLVQRA
jgi:hypothetical protein